MNTEIKLSSDDVKEVMGLIYEYITQGGTGFDNRSLERVYEALGEADRILIVE